MNRPQLFLGSIALLLASCETGPITTGGDFDPLTAPGSGRPSVVASRGYDAGTFVSTSMDAAFFSKRPQGDADADKQLPANTSMKVISDDGIYVKVELDSGEVGYVPSVLVSDGRGGGDLMEVSPDAYQVYPAIPGGGAPPPMIDESIPTIPAVIDPDAPVIPDAPPVPVEEPLAPESVPLPPGNEAE